MQNKSTTLDVVEDPLTGDLILQLTDELCNEMGWAVGDTLVWEELPNNSWSLKKKITHPLWNRLDEYATYIASKFDGNFERYNNPKYTEDLHFKDWNDTFWKSSLIEKVHLKTIAPSDGKGLWLMHINIFPKIGVELPVLGFDIVAGPKKITGSFMDFSPLHGFEHPYTKYMESKVKDLEWNKQRELPPWAKEIFSENMIAVGNINTDEELEQFIEVTSDLLNYYLDNLEKCAIKAERDTKPILNKYCSNQKLNPHLHRSILAMGISEEDKNLYVNNVLFEEL